MVISARGWRPAAAGVAGAYPLPVIGRGAAQRLARAELAKPAYHPQPSLTARFLGLVSRLLQRLYEGAGHLPGGWWGLVATAALAVIAGTVLLSRSGPAARAGRAVGLGAGAAPASARGHRTAAAQLAQAGDYAAAICEAVRAVAAELDERGVLAPRGGRTADEIAAEAGRALPEHAAGLRAAALAFDEVRYGQRAGSRAGYERIRDLDQRIRASRPGPALTRRPAGVAGEGR